MLILKVSLDTFVLTFRRAQHSELFYTTSIVWKARLIASHRKNRNQQHGMVPTIQLLEIPTEVTTTLSNWHYMAIYKEQAKAYT